MLLGIHLVCLTIGQCNRCYAGMIPMIMQCISYAIYSTIIWPMLNSVVDPKLLGTAYGLNYSLENIGLALGPSLIGYVQNHTYGNDPVSWTLVGVCLCCV